MAVSSEPKRNVNHIGLTKADYAGGPSTLCNGCGHDSITSRIIEAYYKMGVPPHMVAKLSGIGCSSKTPAYFLNRAHGFNGVHGRMPAIATGAMVANRQLKAIGVSGDGDTASIGLGQFCHMVRRNVPMVYIIENNGVYGLTKGQFSATADMGSASKGGAHNEMPPIDMCMLALQLGCSYVARGFSGDPRQLSTLLQGAIAHEGCAILDVISPCVTFNNHEGSTKSYKYAKDHEIPLHELDFIPSFEPIELVGDFDPGAIRDVKLHDGSVIRLRKTDRDYDPGSKSQAMLTLLQAEENQEFLTGLIFHDQTRRNLIEQLDMVDDPLATLPLGRTRPPREAFEQVMHALM
ncbi:MAG: 2-oxoacid:ferredoxin oxidoreductase subunit beta [Candidatus Sericytochromatia bacterium]|nr:2-oxoacid:ferredoxin oxidoreductase subunit beta [Candidatus Tanganyikabacteria bacterium]